MITLTAIFFLLLYYMYRKAFYADRKHAVTPYDEAPFKGYKENYKKIKIGIDHLVSLPYEACEIISYDGLKLSGKFYNFYPNAPVLIFFHGYKSNGLRDGLGAVKMCEEAGVNLLIVDQRAHHQSEGKTITFGVKERYDCKSWIDYTIEKCGNNVKIYLFGISMGATTVLMASQLNLPENVKSITADCGYTCPRDILKDVLRQMKLPANLVYPLLRLSAKIYGNFDPDSASAEEALKSCKIPVLFIHGGEDDYVPCNMSVKNHAACASEDKQLIIFPHSAHGMSYYEDTEKYRTACFNMLEK